MHDQNGRTSQMDRLDIEQKILSNMVYAGMGHLRIFPEFRIFFLSSVEKKTRARQVDYFFVWEKLAV